MTVPVGFVLGRWDVADLAVEPYRVVPVDPFDDRDLADADLPTGPGDDLELWLIEPDASGNPKDVAPVSLIDSSKPGEYSVPAGLDPSSHCVVDISIEPRDGDAAHSGKSILRGALEPA